MLFSFLSFYYHLSCSYFANVSSIQEALRKYDGSGYGDSEGQPVQYVIIDLTPVSSVDSAACQALTDIYQEYKVRKSSFSYLISPLVIMSISFFL